MRLTAVLEFWVELLYDDSFIVDFCGRLSRVVLDHEVLELLKCVKLRIVFHTFILPVIVHGLEILWLDIKNLLLSLLTQIKLLRK